MNQTRPEKFTRKDKAYLAKRKQLAENIGISNLWSIADHFGLYSGVQTIGTRLAVYEILKECLHVPGHLVEFGSWKGANLLFIAKVLELLQPNTHKHLFSFDSFEGLQTFSQKDGNSKHLKGEYKGDEEVLKAMIDFFEFDEWIHLIKGNALETIPTFEKENPHVMFSFAYLDFDLYEPTKVALDFVGKRLSPGGIIAFDEALMNTWPGEGEAMIEFLAGQGAGAYQVKNIFFSRQPTAYLIKL